MLLSRELRLVQPKEAMMKRKIRTTAAAVIASAGLFLSGTGIAYAAEGSFTSYLTQVQPGFQSRTWTDNGSTSDSTSITLSGCAVNKAGAAYGSTSLSSVEITLYSNTGWFGTPRKLKSLSKACGTYSFGNYGSGSYWFVVSKINGNSSANRTIFLNASTVRVSY